MAGQPTNMDQFEAYFRRADLDGDGRISGTEAVNFFQGANLPKQVLAQIWMHADQSRTGFLGRPDFYNALKLATVAQSKRELTPDIVKAALYGPAASKIPPPKIILPPIPVQQVNPVAAAASASAPQMPPLHNQALGFRGPGLPNAAINQHYFPPSPQTQTMRPPQVVPPGIASHPPHGIVNPDFSRGGGTVMAHSRLMPTTTSPTPTATASRPPQSMPAPTATPTIPNSNISTDWLAGKSTVALSAPLSTSNVTIHSQTQVSMPSQPSAIDSKPLVVSGNGFATGMSFGGDMFSATPSTRRQEPFVPNYSSAAPPASATMVPVTSGGLSFKSNSLDSLQSAYAMQPLGGQLQRTQSLPTSGQQVSTSVSSSLTSPSISAGVGNSSDNSQPTWPKMKPSDVQKYTKVFMEVDTDRDGRITGEQARNLFLSWRLPREVLKQVWDLSDQDNDSMLSLREFCFALYLMERYREGRPLPASLPSNVMFDETLLSMTGQPKATYGKAAWGPNPGVGQQPGMGARPIGPATGLRPPVQVSPLQSQPDSVLVSNQQKPKAPVLEDSFLNQSDSGEQNSMPKDGTATENKVESEKMILDSREKIEFYRSKMQDLVLYKSRCDNRLNEITERALADKREAEILGKKYEEKYKQVAEVASKLTIEEATFRDIQERKFELNQAIVNMEQGGSADGILQVRADRIQSDLDELLRVLIERSKKHGLEVKSAAMIELPFGWQPGIQEGAAVWDEDWDKFEDEGFANDLTIDVTNSKSTVQKEIGSQEGSLTPDSLSNGGGKSANFFSTSEHALESESAYGHSEDELARSPRGSSTGRTALESPSQDFSDVFAKSAEADAETHRSFDESTWGAFDTHDETDSVWGFNPSSTKDSDSRRDFFGTGDFGVKPIRTGSPSSDSLFQKKSPFFEDSVAGSPVSRFANSPRYSEAGDHSDNFSRLESFNMHEGGFSPRERLTRFDSINSSKDFGHSRAFSSFDDADPFGSSGPFKVSSDNQTPKKGSESWGGF